MIWWFAQPSRARIESLAIAELADRHDWLGAVEWKLTGEARLTADFEIEHLGTAIPMRIVYPSFFPDMPPRVMPREEIRLSGHQYGAGGELCLEYRPDNWDPSFTGAMMIESARRLIEGEEPKPGVEARVDSAHSTSVAQDVRNEKLRFMTPASFVAVLSSLPMAVAMEFEISEHLVKEHWLAVPWRIGTEEHPVWTCGADVPRYQRRTGFAFRLEPQQRWRISADYDVVAAMAGSTLHDPLTALLESGAEQSVVLIECAGDIHLMWLAAGGGKRSIVEYATVQVPGAASRLPAEYERLASMSVAVVGCGSVGSKIAASLARAGIGRFVLVDGDILFPANLVRNDLDWRSVGLNKPNAVARRIHEIRPSAKVSTRRIVLGGQESSAATDAALVEVGSCDLIVDATADPQIYNLCAAVARNEMKTLVWGEVFGGGVGGLVARLRPEIEPVPHAARRQILQWCADRGRKPTEGDAVQYGLSLDEASPPLIADDADVGVIAAHMTRLALDALSRAESLFPQAAYAIGLKTDWIFDAPFDTWPIELVAEGTWGPEKDERQAEELEALAAQLFPDAGKDAVE